MKRTVELFTRFGSDSALGVVYDRAAGASLLSDGGRASNCADCAHFIQSLEPQTEIYGFWSKDNPTWAGAALHDGHDFAVVEGRYIVDPWMVETEALSKRAVFDLENPADASEICRLYGNCFKWFLTEEAVPVLTGTAPESQWSDAPCVITDAEFALAEFSGTRRRSRRGGYLPS